MESFKSKVLSIVKDIKAGETLSYQEVAKRAGNIEACRAVGMILNKNYDLSIPCHRVIRKNGQVGGYNRGVDEKMKKLKNEGIKKIIN